jgi:hypothetical protein
MFLFSFHAFNKFFASFIMLDEPKKLNSMIFILNIREDFQIMSTEYNFGHTSNEKGMPLNIISRMSR